MFCLTPELVPHTETTMEDLWMFLLKGSHSTSNNDMDPPTLSDLILLLSNDVESNPGPFGKNNNLNSIFQRNSSNSNSKVIEDLQREIRSLHAIADHQVQYIATSICYTSSLNSCEDQFGYF